MAFLATEEESEKADLWTLTEGDAAACAKLSSVVCRSCVDRIDGTGGFPRAGESAEPKKRGKVCRGASTVAPATLMLAGTHSWRTSRDFGSCRVRSEIGTEGACRGAEREGEGEAGQRILRRRRIRCEMGSWMTCYLVKRVNKKARENE